MGRILGFGTDLLRTARIGELVRRRGLPRLAHRILTTDEQRALDSVVGQPAQERFLAVRCVSFRRYLLMPPIPETRALVAAQLGRQRGALQGPPAALHPKLERRLDPRFVLESQAARRVQCERPARRRWSDGPPECQPRWRIPRRWRRRRARVIPVASSSCAASQTTIIQGQSRAVRCLYKGKRADSSTARWSTLSRPTGGRQRSEHPVTAPSEL